MSKLNHENALLKISSLGIEINTFFYRMRNTCILKLKQLYIMKKLALLLIFTTFGTQQFFTQNVSDNIENALGAVVTIAVHKPLPAGKVLMGYRGGIAEDAYAKSLELTNAVSSGSGFIIQKNGKKYIITNAHVVESASDEPGSLFAYSYNRKKYEMKILGGDSFYDIAVLEFVNAPGAELSALTFDPVIPKIATKVFAIGNPLGEYPYTVTDGIVSAINRTRGGLTGKYGFLQSTATVIWGNSGGPLVTEEGRVVGINSQIAFAPSPDGSKFQMQQINFALEAPLAQRLVDEIISYGKPIRSYLGLELKRAYQLKKTANGWAIAGAIDELPVISRVSKGSEAASKLSAYSGWNVKAINGIEISNLEEALGEFEKIKPNTTVALKLVNMNTEKEVSLRATELKPAHLQQLASDVLSRIPSVSVDANSPQVKIYSQQEQGFGNTKVGYYIAGGGNAESKDLWRVTTLTDLGSLLKIYGLSGGVEYVLVSEANTKAQPQVYKQYFGDSPDVFQTMLWY